MEWWTRGEFADQVGDTQAPADLRESGIADMIGVDQAIDAMVATPIGEPDSDFDVRSVYDSRPVNAYDFNFSANADLSSEGSGFSWTVTFTVPNGYRAVPREWDVLYDPGFASANSYSDSFVTIQQSGAALPNNGPITVGIGTYDPIKTFFLCEENTTFGMTGFTALTNSSQASSVNVNVYGNLIPVSEVALPFCIANQRYQT
jgi:hypothetical protein